MIGIFEIFEIGIGPSSSHTVGPMRAAATFVAALSERGEIGRVASLTATLYGSLAFTGKGHATDRAVILGLAGEWPATVDPDRAEGIVRRASEDGLLALGATRDIAFRPDRDIVFDYETPPPGHPNALKFTARDAKGDAVAEEIWLSTGGGFVRRHGEDAAATEADGPAVPHPFDDADEMLERAEAAGLDLATLSRQNDCARRSEAEVEAHVDRVLAAMFDCIERGLAAEGELPGGLKVKRRARSLAGRLGNTAATALPPHSALDLVGAWAMAVNEENAAGGRVVTAPTNGAAGVVPAVLRYARDFRPEVGPDGLRRFLHVAAAIGWLFKRNASISGAEVGCQGEIGVAAAMAAAGLAAALGGTNAQVENAAEIAMEHHLGMTCDPIAGLVQIPCIERNAFGAIKAIAAATLALAGDGTHFVSLDEVIVTMRETGADMQSKYKETSRGGLAVNVVDC